MSSIHGSVVLLDRIYLVGDQVFSNVQVVNFRRDRQQIFIEGELSFGQWPILALLLEHFNLVLDALVQNVLKLAVVLVGANRVLQAVVVISEDQISVELLPEAIDALLELDSELVGQPLLSFHLAQDDVRQLHLNGVSVLKDHSGALEGLGDYQAVKVAALNFDRESSDESNSHAKDNLRLLYLRADLLSFSRSILLKDGVEVVELGGGAPPLLAVGLNALEQNLLLVEQHDLVELWL